MRSVELGIERLRASKAPVCGVHLGLDVQQAIVTQFSQNPFPIAGYGQTARPSREVAQLQDANFTGHPWQHKPVQLGGDAVLGLVPLEHRVAEAVTDDVGFAPRAGSGVGDQNCPVCSSPEVEGFTGDVGDGIIVPGRQAELVAILDPGVALPLFRDDRPEKGLASTFTQGAGVTWSADNVMTYSRPSRVKPPRPFMKDQVPLGAAQTNRATGAGRPEQRNDRLRGAGSIQLFGQRSVFIRQDQARDGLEQHPVFAGNLFQAPDKDAARLVEQLVFDARGNQTEDWSCKGWRYTETSSLRITRSTGNPFIRQ